MKEETQDDDVDTDSDENYDTSQIDKQISLYLDCLPHKYFDSYDDWIKIGFVIFNEKGSFNLFDKYSKLSSKYNEKDCRKTWKSFGNNGSNKATLSTLMLLAKEENYGKFYKALNHDFNSLLSNIFIEGVNDVSASRLFYSINHKKFVYDVDNDMWYKFSKFGIYVADTGAISLMDSINKTLHRVVENEYENRKRKLLYQRNDPLADDDEEKSHTKLLKKLKSNYSCTSRYLTKSCNKKNIISELKTLCRVPGIYERMDNINMHLIGFTNGVYDIENDIFRYGKPDELVSCTTKYDYSEPDATCVQFLFDVVRSIFPDSTELEYFMMVCSLSLLGENLLEEGYFWIGTGSNGKGLMRDILASTLGDYFDNMEIEYLCKTRQQTHGSKDADPVMARKKNVRLVISTEPEGDVEIKSAKFKQLSGRDPVQVRDLFKSPFNFTPKFKLIIQTNFLPRLDGFDSALKRRIKVISFPNTFVDDPKLPNERKIDRTLKIKLKEHKCKIAFFHILLKYYKQFVKHKCKLIVPERFRKDTEEYLRDNDPVQDFIDSYIIKTSDPKDCVKSNVLYQLFFSQNSVNILTPAVFKNTMIRKGFRYIRKSSGVVIQYIKLIQCDE